MMPDEPIINPQDPPVIVPEEDKEKARLAQLEKDAKEKDYWKGVADGRATTPVAAAPQIPAAPQPPADPEPTVPDEPRFEDFADPGKFYSAQTKYLQSQQRREAWKERQESRQRETVERQQRADAESRQKAMTTFETRLADTAKVEPDIYAIRDSIGARVTPHTAKLIIESEHAPRVLRHFSENPADLARINSLDPASAIREMTKLELTVSKGLVDDTGRAKRVSSTPSPIDTVPGGGPGAAIEDPRDPDASSKMQPDDWVYKRNVQVAGMMDQARAARTAQR